MEFPKSSLGSERGNCPMNQKRFTLSWYRKLNHLGFLHRLWMQNLNFLDRAGVKLTKRHENNQHTEIRYSNRFAKPYVDYILGGIREVYLLIGNNVRLFTREILL